LYVKSNFILTLGVKEMNDKINCIDNPMTI